MTASRALPILFVLAAGSIASPAWGAQAARDAVAPGQAAPEFTLPVAGEAANLALKRELEKNKLTVLLFIATQCPVSNAYNTRMAAIAEDYQGQGVGFIGVNSNKQEPVDEIVAHARENGFSFPVVKDAGNRVADLYGARVTPEVFVIDDTGQVRYHGRIDERQNAASAADIKSPDLRNALDALLEGKPAPNADTKAFGCSIKRV
jgi:peroxiredoxin